jgi:S-adenosylmethionine synthetase
MSSAAPTYRNALPSFDDADGPVLFTSESVTEGHPDKVADQISDAILDAHLASDPRARVACETLVTTNRVVIAGEITSSAAVDVARTARDTIREIGYDRPDNGFDADSCTVDVLLHAQAPDIAAGVDTGGAGDQGLMFGFACDETPELMPMPIALAHRLTRRLSDARRTGELGWLRPDGKSQVTVEYRHGRPQRIAAVVVSSHHDRAVDNGTIHREIRSRVIEAALPSELLDAETVIHINPTGRFEDGGPKADCGLTGRKIIVDTYGGAAPHGGGAFSGKDATKVDRSATYMARHVAKCLVAAGLARRALVQLAYAIGVAEPVSVLVDSLGTGTVSDGELARRVRDAFPLTPAGIIEHLQLRRPVFRATAAFGHFGRDEDGFTWEHTSPLPAALVNGRRTAAGG